VSLVNLEFGASYRQARVLLRTKDILAKTLPESDTFFAQSISYYPE
jgi:hypothetical protein